MFDLSPSYSILSIDGGGIRGIIPCTVLIHIEKQTGMPIADLFDMMAGTSTGGLLACGLSLKGEDGRPKKTAESLLDLYCGPNGAKIFSQPRMGPLNAIRALFRAKFPPKGIEGVLKEEFGDAKLSDSLTDLLITSYNMVQKTPFYFKSSDARIDPENEDFLIRDIARSTSAAPTYFPPHQVAYGGTYLGQKIESLCLADGGVFANNPSLLAFIEARNKWRESDDFKAMVKKIEEFIAEEAATADEEKKGMLASAQKGNFEAPFFLLSIGTGQSRKPYPFDTSKKWGAMKWILPIIDILMQGVSESVHYQMENLLPPFDDFQETPRYIRLNVELDKKDTAMDDVSDKATSRLRDHYGGMIIEQNKETLETVCNLLVQISKARRKRS
ncbi:MAG: patatin-like phospholipase family protein [Bacteroidota bacterium]